MIGKLQSPFRYPGGKTKIAKRISDLIGTEYDCSAPLTFVDVFVGGGSVSLKVAEDFNNASLILNDLDRWMHAFWNRMAVGDEEVLSYLEGYDPPTVNDFRYWREKATEEDLSDSEQAFVALFFNRTAFSGIFKSGPMGGYEQNGKYKIDSRYNRESLQERVGLIIDEFRNRDVEVSQQDFRDVISKYGKKRNHVLYLDPPYMKEGKVLYNHFMQYEDYADMAYMLSNAKCNWIVSHNDHPDFVAMYDGWTNITNIEGFPYTINSIKGKKRVELLITNIEEK